MKVYDCFLFFNELDILEIRLNLLYPFVDYFIISEAETTFSGLSKPLYYLENKERFSKFEDKIIHNVVRGATDEQLRTLGNKYQTNVIFHQTDAWQKDTIAEKLFDTCDAKDIIIWSDVDEIPNPDYIAVLKSFYEHGTVYNFAQEYCMCYLNMIERSGCFRSQTYDDNHNSYPKWIGTKAFDLEFLNKYTLTDMRRPLPLEKNFRIDRGGWHWTYVGSEGLSVEDRVVKKIEGAAHQEFNNNDVKMRVSDLLRNNQDPLGRGGSYEVVAIDNSYPDYIVKNTDKYGYLIKDK
jgi:beta-1,4-mannosyl-glycoprotein beta-1,4-N-acetylglucosaminyltransferase